MVQDPSLEDPSLEDPSLEDPSVEPSGETARGNPTAFAASGCPFHASGSGATASTLDASRAAEPSKVSHAPRAARSDSVKPPAAPSVPLLGWRGNLARFFRDPPRAIEQMRSIGDVVRFADRPHPPLLFEPEADAQSTVFCFRPEAVRTVLLDSERFGGGRVRAPKTARWLRSSVTRVDDHAQRQATARQLNKQHVRRHLPTVVESARTMLAEWRDLDEVDLGPALETVCAEIAGRVFFGRSPDRVDRFGNAARQLMSALFSPGSMVPIDLPGTPYRRLAKLSDRVQQALLEEVVRKRRAAERDAEGGVDADDLLAAMAKVDDPDARISDDELTFRAFGLFVAGHDVPASTVAFALVILGQHPEILADLVDEIDAAAKGEDPTVDSLDRMPLLDRAYKECLRVLGPPFLISRRVGPQGATLREYDLPPGTEVLISPWASHTDPLLWERVREFDPSRWDGPSPSPYAFFPYSHGAHKCIGSIFAEYEVKALLAMILRSVRLEPAHNARLDLAFTFIIRPRFAQPFRLRRDRDWRRSQVPLRGKMAKMVDFAA